MFTLNKLNVYNEAQNITTEVFEVVNKITKGDPMIINETKITGLYILKQTAKGSGTYVRKDQKFALNSARNYIYQIIALLETLRNQGLLKEDKFNYLSEKYFGLTKMLSSLGKKVGEQLKTS